MYVTTLPAFQKIQIDRIENDLTTLLEKNLQTIDALLEQPNYTWDNFVQPLEELDDTLQQFWGPISHLNAVMNSDALRKTMQACLPKLSEYGTRLSHNEKLFHAFEKMRASAEFAQYDAAQKKSIDNELRDFKLAGVHLPPEKKEIFAALCKKSSQLTQQFEENVLDATMAYRYLITDEKELSGIPEHAILGAKKLAEKENKVGALFTLEAPDYLAIMLHADSRALREQFYRAYVTRASELSDAGKFDNSKLMRDILKNRFEIARLLGFENYAQYALSTKMVKKPEDVFAFLNQLLDKSRTQAQKEFAALQAFAKTQLSMSELKAWDIGYVSEKMRQHLFQLSQETLRPYFPENRVMQGLFSIITKLYDVTFEKNVNADVWHNDVTCYALKDQAGETIAHIYFDLYARPNKRGGAWMDDAVTRRQLSENKIQLPAAYVNTNFNAPVGNNPALFTHDDVVTLFHECGHALQHVLTKIDVPDVSGISGVPWDAVEVASQFFENWTMDKKALHYLAKHYQTGETLPESLLTAMHDARNFQSAMQMVRQLEFALFDFELHCYYDENDPDFIQKTLDKVRQKTAVIPAPEFNRFQHTFSHIFAGGYAAGYYSYKWAEVMACDAFSLFEEKGIFDHDSATRFKKTFLESGGARDPLDLFIEFRGRKPNVDALLEQNGIIASMAN